MTAAPAVVESLASSVHHVVFLPAPFRTPHPFFQQPNPMATVYAGLEQLLADSGLVSSIIRPGGFASNALSWWAPAIRSRHAIRWPYAAAETAPVDDLDVAAVAARMLIDDGHLGGDVVLTGPASLTQADQVRIIGAALGRDIPFAELSPEEFRRETAGSWPPPAAEMLLAAWNATLGRPAYVTSSVSEILGAPARTFQQWASDHVPAFT